jgi:hypothetical protein
MIFMPFSCLVGAHLSTAALAIAVIAGQQLAHLRQTNWVTKSAHCQGSTRRRSPRPVDWRSAPGTAD